MARTHTYNEPDRLKENHVPTLDLAEYTHATSNDNVDSWRDAAYMRGHDSMPPEESDDDQE